MVGGQWTIQENTNKISFVMAYLHRIGMGTYKGDGWARLAESCVARYTFWMSESDLGISCASALGTALFYCPLGIIVGVTFWWWGDGGGFDSELKRVTCMEDSIAYETSDCHYLLYILAHCFFDCCDRVVVGHNNVYV
jgi:hypothetical protein